MTESHRSIIHCNNASCCQLKHLECRLLGCAFQSIASKVNDALEIILVNDLLSHAVLIVKECLSRCDDLVRFCNSLIELIQVEAQKSRQIHIGIA